MADQNQGSLVGGDTLEAVNEAMVALHERYHGSKPATARTQMMGDDMLACLLGDVYTDVEKTMIELQRQALVTEDAQHFSTGDGAPLHRGCRAADRATGGAVHLDAPRGTRSRARAVRA